MLPKLKSQFEELRSRVAFLERVRKYLEVEARLLVCLALPKHSLQRRVSSCALEGSPRGPLGFGGFAAALPGGLWTFCPCGSPVLRGAVGALLQHQQGKGLPAEWISPGPHGLSLREVASFCLLLFFFCFLLSFVSSGGCTVLGAKQRGQCVFLLLLFAFLDLLITGIFPEQQEDSRSSHRDLPFFYGIWGAPIHLDL